MASGFGLVGTLYGVYTGIGHLDYRRVLQTRSQEENARCYQQFYCGSYPYGIAVIAALGAVWAIYAKGVSDERNERQVETLQTEIEVRDRRIAREPRLGHRMPSARKTPRSGSPHSTTV